ncbi:3-isopropylmalate dehydratase small subunit [bacterium]|jgi:3-isopropylmalate/(R)-2-methylmalate dehydratase small subunit|nr:3-isopropylmalate dehydratase small subunit [bacterium]
MTTTLQRKLIKGTAVPIRGNEIDTDRIIPARFLKETTFDSMGEYLFIDARFSPDKTPKDHPLNESRFEGASIMIVGNNFGCGSSREHAPQAILRAGFNALIGESFGEIFAGNCKSVGVPAVQATKTDIESLTMTVEKTPNAEVQLNLETMQVVVTHADRGVLLTVSITMPEERRQTFLEGTWDELTLLVSNMDLIKTTAAKLPYITGYE